MPFADKRDRYLAQFELLGELWVGVEVHQNRLELLAGECKAVGGDRGLRGGFVALRSEHAEEDRPPQTIDDGGERGWGRRLFGGNADQRLHKHLEEVPPGQTVEADWGERRWPLQDDRWGAFYAQALDQRWVAIEFVDDELHVRARSGDVFERLLSRGASRAGVGAWGCAWEDQAALALVEVVDRDRRAQ